MIRLYIDGMPAAVPEDLTIDYTVENPDAGEAGGYSMTIELPLAGSPENQRIFGYLWRKDIGLDKIRYNARIQDREVIIDGLATIVGMSETSVSIQLLAGKSAENFRDRQDPVYIDELDIGYAADTYPGKVTPADALRSIDDGAESVALPWVMAGSGEMIHNRILTDRNGNLVWDPRLYALSRMPYLLVVARKIAEAAGYRTDFRDWENSMERHLVVCNPIPEAVRIRQWAWQLPHWTVAEFFGNLETVLRGVFDIDEIGMKIGFRKKESVMKDIPEIIISKVIDQFSAEVRADSEKSERPTFMKNIAYKENSGRFWPVRCCDWYIRRLLDEEILEPEPGQTGGLVTRGPRDTARPRGGWTNATIPRPTDYNRLKIFPDMDALVKATAPYKYSVNARYDGQDNVFYVEQTRCYFVLHAAAMVKGSDIREDERPENFDPEQNYYVNELVVCNDFGARIIDDGDDADTVELPVVPVDIDKAEGLCMFIPFSSADYSEEEQETPGLDPDDPDTFRQPAAFSEIMDGKKEKPQFYDRIYLAYWPGWTEANDRIGPVPFTSNVTVFKCFSYVLTPEYSLRLNDYSETWRDIRLAANPDRVYRFRFQTGQLPDTRAIFNILGRRYVCLKIETSLGDGSIPRLVDGEFIRID